MSRTVEIVSEILNSKTLAREDVVELLEEYHSIKMKPIEIVYKFQIKSVAEKSAGAVFDFLGDWIPEKRLEEYRVTMLKYLKENHPQSRSEKELVELSCKHGVPYRYDCEYCRKNIEPYNCKHGVDSQLGCPKCDSEFSGEVYEYCIRCLNKLNECTCLENSKPNQKK